MLTCSGCRVAKFCGAEHQKMASKKAALGGSLTTGRHKDICGVLRKWRDVVKDGVAPDSCPVELVAFLQREMRDAPRSARGSSLITGVQGVALQNEVLGERFDKVVRAETQEEDE